MSSQNTKYKIIKHKTSTIISNDELLGKTGKFIIYIVHIVPIEI